MVMMGCSIFATADKVIPLGEIGKPDAIAVDDQQIYIAEVATIHILSRDGKYIKKFGKRGEGPEEFLVVPNLPLYITRRPNDLVISSLMFHHLPVTLKREGMIEICRVLKKGGRFFLCDFGSPNLLTVLLMGPLFIWMSSTRFHLLGRLPALLKASQFKSVELIKKGVFLEYYIMRK